jgi:hypothetical protein
MASAVAGGREPDLERIAGERERLVPPGWKPTGADAA